MENKKEIINEIEQEDLLAELQAYHAFLGIDGDFYSYATETSFGKCYMHIPLKDHKESFGKQVKAKLLLKWLV